VGFIINYITTPVSTELQTSLAYGREAAYSGNFPMNIFDTWTLRGTGYKIIMFVFYQLTQTIADYENKILFEIIFQTSAAGFNVICSAIIARAGYDRLQQAVTTRQFRYPIIFLMVSTFIFTISWKIEFQPEMLATTLTLVAISISILSKRFGAYIAGAIMTFVATIKGITVLLIIPMTGTLLLLNVKRTHVRDMLISFVVFSGIAGATAMIFAPSEITDIIYAAQIQDVGDKTVLNRVKTVLVSVFRLEHIPSLLLGIPGGVSVLIYYWYRKMFLDIGILLSVVAGACLPIFIQANNFPYQYAPLLLPTFLVIHLGFISISEHVPEISNKMVFVSVTVFIIFSIVSSTWLAPIFASGIHSGPVKDGSPVFHANRVDSQRDVYQSINSHHNFHQEDSVLYLASGQPAYYLASKSHSRYYFPLPLTAKSDNPDIVYTKPYKRIYEAIMNYSGRYIVYEPRFLDLTEHPRIEMKIKTEYCLVYSSRVSAQSRSLQHPVKVYKQKEATHSATCNMSRR
jgi:hypothetical protein